MTLDVFLQDAWRDHGDAPQAVAERLVASLHLIASATDIAPYARLVTHVFGEHLDQPGPGAALLESLRTLPIFDGGSAAASAVNQGIAALRYLHAGEAALAGLSVQEQVCALAVVSGICVGRMQHDAALQVLGTALKAVPGDWPADAPAHRALAVAGNNLACALEERADRTDAQTHGMLDAARAALTYWKLAGTWLEEERAEYQLTRCLLQAGEAQLALSSAQRCLALCQQHAAPAFERFFAHVVLALAARRLHNTGLFAEQRAAALQCHGEVSVQDQPWCARELAELGAELAGPSAAPQ
ncbi:MAG: hypothetical protein K9K38_12920 [Rhodoferax sp.]|nr:hypothetical protein [Rhodoferax sp.]MCF8210280.1 hypothetical protein [Rhodoferax sp.]